MIRIGLAVFVTLHAVVHALYAGHAAGWYQMQKGMAWPTESWLFVEALGTQVLRMSAAAGLLAAAIGFSAAGVTILRDLPGQQFLLILSAAVSLAVFLVFWDGSPRHLLDSGLIGLAIDVGLLAAAVFFIEQL